MMVSAISQFFVILSSIALSFWCLQAIRFDVFFKTTHVSQAKGLHILLSIVLGYELARFIMEMSSLF
jgi:uncharacterized integral membrane protein (TIGR02327 family)